MDDLEKIRRAVRLVHERGAAPNVGPNTADVDENGVVHVRDPDGALVSMMSFDTFEALGLAIHKADGDAGE
jgi:hypothetical protein